MPDISYFIPKDSDGVCKDVLGEIFCGILKAGGVKTASNYVSKWSFRLYIHYIIDYVHQRRKCMEDYDRCGGNLNYPKDAA